MRKKFKNQLRIHRETAYRFESRLKQTTVLGKKTNLNISANPEPIFNFFSVLKSGEVALLILSGKNEYFEKVPDKK